MDNNNKDIKDYLSGVDIPEEVIRNVSDGDYFERSVEVMDRAYAQRDEEGFVRSLRAREAKARERRANRRRVIASLSIAAAVLFVTFLVYNKSRVKMVTTTIAQANVYINYSVPTLILESGEAISVDNSAKVAELSENLERVVAENKITYDLSKIDDTKVIAADTVVYNKMIVPAKSKYTVVLSDGTVVELNANSTFEYPVDFKGDNREVKLTGEAYFEVTKSDKPFIVAMGDERVKVYGTEFNIKSYKRQDTEVILVEGSVGYSNETIDKEVMMVPNQMIKMTDGEYELTDVEVDDYLAWKKDLFKYKSQDIYTILSDIASWYNIEFNVKLKGGDIDEVYTFIMSRDLTQEKIIEQLSLRTGLIFIRERKEAYTVGNF